MKIAIPTREGVVDDHFGHCEMYTLLTVDENNSIQNTEHLPSPQGCGCKSNIAAVLQQQGVTVMLAGNMGAGALQILNRFGIEVYRGCSGDIRQLAESFLAGNTVDSGQGCQQHEAHHAGHHGHNQGEHQCGHE
jgi:predicted Fe-Mo cluster-binding NifX family protein